MSLQQDRRLKHFVNNSWGAVRISERQKYQVDLVLENIEIPGSNIVFLKKPVAFDSRKIISFWSVLNKIFGQSFKFRLLGRQGDQEFELLTLARERWKNDARFFSTDSRVGIS